MKEKGTITRNHAALYLGPGAHLARKIQLYSRELKEKGLDPLPVYTPMEDPPQGMFRLLYGRSPLHTFGRTVNSPILGGLYGENEVWVNKAIAEDLGLQDGERVMLRNQDGRESGPVRVKATRRIRPDCVYLVHGFGRAAKGLTRARGKGASDNDLMSRYAVDPLTGGTGSSMNFVTLRRL
jgi:thiosulfate reductase/polysulfide reductase chain A